MSLLQNDQLIEALRERGYNNFEIKSLLDEIPEKDPDDYSDFSGASYFNGNER